MIESSYRFEPQRHEETLEALIEELEALDEWSRPAYERLLRRYPKNGRGFYSKAEILAGFRHLNAERDWRRDERRFAAKIRMKPIRTLSGVAPVTVLTKPYPCPGRCIFCPSDVRMPKSYLSDEPGAQRAAEHRFDPYRQTLSRLRALHNIGHPVDKVEMIVLGGTWSSYPEPYQVWFVTRCFDALNDFEAWRRDEPIDWPDDPPVDYSSNAERIDGARPVRSYNAAVAAFAERQAAEPTPAERDCDVDWERLAAAQERNETAAARCVGLVLETRPDRLDDAEALRLRRLGATKIQLGLQSLDDRVLALNRRGHDVAATGRAFRLLRGMGFKIHAHWMPNLYGSTPERDVDDFGRLFADPAFRPDELKIYPCSLIESAELMRHYESGAWRPYEHDELLAVLTACLDRTPEYCRVTRVVRDIPGTDIVDGNKLTNFREIAERAMDERGQRRREIRSREVRSQSVDPAELTLQRIDYATSSGGEVFFQFVTPDDRLAAFLRLALPATPAAVEELGRSAVIREVHVYGRLVEIGGRKPGRSQHRGLGRRLIEAADEEARARGFTNLAVISSVGTRRYYRSLGFTDGALYQHRSLVTDR